MSKPLNDSNTRSDAASVWMSIAASASQKDVSSRTVRRWLTLGLPFVQPTKRGKILIRLSDLDTWLNAKRTVKPTLDAIVNSSVEEVMGAFARKGRP